jgi:nucleotide-binding universal stress UspA family protein
MKRHTILVPLDGSRFSRQILPHVHSLFAPETASIILLRVADAPQGLVAVPRPLGTHWPVLGYDSPEEAVRARHPIYSTQEEASTRAALIEHESGQRHQLESAGYHVSMLVRFGDPVEEIVSCVTQQRADLIAMATHGWTGLRHIVLGSVADQVLRRVSVPVLFFRPLAHEHDMQLQERARGVEI